MPDSVPTKNMTKQCPKCGGSGQIMDDAFMGSAMRAAREAAGLSARELARRIKWSAAYVSDLELGRRAWDEEKRKRYESGLPKKCPCPKRCDGRAGISFPTCRGPKTPGCQQPTL